MKQEIKLTKLQKNVLARAYSEVVRKVTNNCHASEYIYHALIQEMEFNKRGYRYYISKSKLYEMTEYTKSILKSFNLDFEMNYSDLFQFYFDKCHYYESSGGKLVAILYRMSSPFPENEQAA